MFWNVIRSHVFCVCQDLSRFRILNLKFSLALAQQHQSSISEQWMPKSGGWREDDQPGLGSDRDAPSLWCVGSHRGVSKMDWLAVKRQCQAVSLHIDRVTSPGYWGREAVQSTLKACAQDDSICWGCTAEENPSHAGRIQSRGRIVETCEIEALQTHSGLKITLQAAAALRYHVMLSAHIRR